MELEYQPDSKRYEGSMNYRRCGNSGVFLPELSLGMWQNFGADRNYRRCQEIILYAFDKGITHFDLANNYGPPNGAAEETFGRTFRKVLKPFRDELFISTKSGHLMWPGPYGNGGSRKYLISSLDQSLKRMNLEYVDVYYSHRYDQNAPIEETMQALVDIVHSGKALYVGISKYPKIQAEQAYDYLVKHNVPCLLYQGRYNLFDRRVEEGILKTAQDRGVGFAAFSPLAQGLLTDRYLAGVPEDSRMATSALLNQSSLTQQLTNRIQSLQKIAHQRGQNLAEMALAWLLKDKQVTTLIVGVSSVEQLKNNLKAIQNTGFGEDELEEIERILE